jgi:AraC-like DNA-binding protein
MQNFYKKALTALSLLLAMDGLVASFCVYRSYPSAPLLPMRAAGLAWRAAGTTDVPDGGASTIRISESDRKLVYDFNISDAWRYPYASADVVFVNEQGRPAVADLSRYTRLSFVAKCQPRNWLKLMLLTFEPGLSKPGKLLTYPTPETHFSCNQKGVKVEVDLTRLSIPQWWLSHLELDLTHQEYQLDKVAKIAFANSWQSPHQLDSHVEISDLVLSGRDYCYLAYLALYLVVSTAGYVVWFFLRHTKALVADLNVQLKKDLPLVAYRQLTLEPHREKEKSAVLRFIATSYTNSDLDLDTVVRETGANRNKVNEVLKAELGLTFSSYLNKLRLTEAARLLLERDTATIAEIAYSVGYSNVSYFNRLFKDEYGCTPKSFRSLAPPCPTQSDAKSETVDGAA